MSATPLVAYTRWHAWEALPRLATPLALFVLLGGMGIWSTLQTMGGIEVVRLPGEENAAIIGVYKQFLTLCMTLGAIVVASGIIALDRERQYVRFLFSHPVVPWQYYLQRYLVTAVMFGLTLMLIPIGFGALVTSVPVVVVGSSALLYALLYGSLAMLCGALVNRDGIAFIAVIVVANALQAARVALPTWMRYVVDALPPFPEASTVRRSLLDGAAVDRGDVTHVVLYSLGMLIAALAIVRRAPLAR